MRSATAPETMVAAVPQNMTWKTKKPICQGVRSERKKKAPLVPTGKAARQAEGEHEADGAEGDDRHGHVEKILLRDVDGVLGAHHARFKQQEAGLHQEHEAGGDQHPDEVEIELQGFERQFLGGGRGGQADRASGKAAAQSKYPS